MPGFGRSDPHFEMACIFTGVSTDAAVQIIDPSTAEQLWIPLSQVSEMHGRKGGQRTEGSIVMSDWIARTKGLTT